MNNTIISTDIDLFFFAYIHKTYVEIGMINFPRSCHVYSYYSTHRLGEADCKKSWVRWKRTMTGLTVGIRITFWRNELYTFRRGFGCRKGTE